MHKFIQVVTTAPNKSCAEKIARVLIKKRLAACVQIAGPVKSIYRWKGKIEKAGEWFCIIKTRARAFNKVEKAIREIHPYEVPEIIAIPITQLSKDYLNWLSLNTKL